MKLMTPWLPVAAIACTWITQLAVAQNPRSGTLAFDINAQAAPAWQARGSDPGALDTRGGQAFFIAQGDQVGRELWFSDGTLSGTRVAGELDPGRNGVNVYSSTKLPDGTLVFASTSRDFGAELFKIAPNSTAIQLVADIQPGPDLGGSLGGSSSPDRLTEWMGEVWFFATEPGSGRELWRSDGTAAGTMLAFDSIPGPAFSSNGVDSIAVAGSSLFFSMGSPTTTLWVMTSPGQAPVALHVQDTPSFRNMVLQPFGARLLFSGWTASAGVEPWVSDGTANGTFRLADIASGPADSQTWFLGADANRVWFAASGNGTGRELWTTDGTTAGTGLVVDLFPGPAIGFHSSSAVFGNGLLFAGDDGRGAGVEVWFTDGTAAGTIRISDIHPGPQGSFPRQFFTAAGRTFFAANDGTRGVELYEFTPNGVQLVADLNPSSDSNPIFVGTTSNGILLGADDGLHGRELFLLDLVGTTTRLLANLRLDPLTGSSFPGFAMEFGDKLVFGANDGLTGMEPWVTDGTPSGTLSLGDIFPGSSGSQPLPLVAIERGLLLSANTAARGSDLWITDGTPSGTVRLASFTTNFAARQIQLAGVIADQAMLVVETSNGNELWRSDGTPSGTQQVPGIPANAMPARPSVIVGNAMLYSGRDATGGRELWRSDGTAAGTQRLLDIAPGVADSAPSAFAVMGGRVLFVADDLARGREPWISDGTALGTRLLADVRVGGAGSDVTSFTVLGDHALFVADDGVHGGELWITDGTTTGTSLLVDLIPGPVASWPALANRAAGPLVYFVLQTTSAWDLWCTDGTTVGTTRLLALGNLPSNFEPMGDGGEVAFLFDNGVHGFEWWKSDGTAAGTRQLTESAPGVESGSPSLLGRLGSTVFFSATDLVNGYEVHSIELDDAGGFVAREFGRGCGGAVGSIRGIARLGRAVTVEVEHPNATLAGVLFATRPAQTPIAPGCFLLLDAPIPGPFAPVPPSGRVALTLPIPAVQALIGAELLSQWVTASIGGPTTIGLSNGMEIVIGR